MAEDATGGTGGCRCGAVRYAFTGKPLWVAHCHCASCRRATGAAVATWVGVAADRFRWLGGAPARFESSPGVFRSFCGRCGAPLTYEADRFAGEVHIAIGSLDEPDRFPPRGHVYVAEQVGWLELADSLPRYAATSREGGPLPPRPREPSGRG